MSNWHPIIPIKARVRVLIKLRKVRFCMEIDYIFVGVTVIVCKSLAPVVQKVDNAIHRINHYPLDGAIGFAITYPMDDLSGG